MPLVAVKGLRRHYHNRSYSSLPNANNDRGKWLQIYVRCKAYTQSPHDALSYWSTLLSVAPASRSVHDVRWYRTLSVWKFENTRKAVRDVCYTSRYGRHEPSNGPAFSTAKYTASRVTVAEIQRTRNMSLFNYEKGRERREKSINSLISLNRYNPSLRLIRL